MTHSNSLSFYAGPAALRQIRSQGMRAQDVAVVPAAAGGPKGLIFHALDQYLFGHWLPGVPRKRTLIGASIGAWRMAAACHADPVAAFTRLADLYCGQSYSPRPSAAEVTAVCVQILSDFIGGHEAEITHHPHYGLHMVTVRGRHLLAAPSNRLSAMTGFAAASVANLFSRASLAQHLERVVIGDARDPVAWLKKEFDAFRTHFVPLGSDNIASALLASGTLPLVMQPVRTLLHAPVGNYWDGGLIDYHLALPYARMAHIADNADNADGRLVLYPHFSQHIIPGWLDKSLPWRSGNRQHRAWLDNVLVVAPSAAFLSTLPRGKLLDRKDFQTYGSDHAGRIRDWRQAISQGQRLRDDFAAFVAAPERQHIEAL